MLLQPTAVLPFLNTFAPLSRVTQRCVLCNSAFTHTEFPLNVAASTSYACSHYCKLMYEEKRVDLTGQTPQVVVNKKKRKITELTENKSDNDIVAAAINKTQNNDVTEINLEYSALILDTNVWINSLPFVQSLKKIRGLQIIVPSIVIQELDSLKVKPGLSLKARAAINFLLEEFNAKAEWIRGQKIEESHKQVRGLTTENTPALSQWTNDDHILDCAMYFTRTTSAALVTQDKALALKAQINQVEVLDVPRLTKRLPVLHDAQYVLVLSAEPANKRHKAAEDAACVAASVSETSNKRAFTPAAVSLATPRTGESSPRAAEHVIAPPRDLPAELWRAVCKCLPPSALSRVARVNKSVSSVVRCDEVWREAIRRTFRDTKDLLVPRDRSARSWYTQWRRNTLAWE